MLISGRVGLLEAEASDVGLAHGGGDLDDAGRDPCSGLVPAPPGRDPGEAVGEAFAVFDRDGDRIQTGDTKPPVGEVHDETEGFERHGLGDGFRQGGAGRLIGHAGGTSTRRLGGPNWVGMTTGAMSRSEALSASIVAYDGAGVDA